MFRLLRRLAPVLVASLVVAACGSGGSTPTPSATPTPSPTPTPTATPTATAAPTGAAGTDPATVGRAFITALSSGDAAHAAALEDPTMQSAAPEAALKQLWQGAEQQYGAFQGLGDVTTAAVPPYTNVTVPVRFAQATVELLVTVDTQGRVAGLHLGQVTYTATPTPAAYVQPDSFTERNVTVGSAPWTLPGTLTMPKGAGPFPGVVLVAGSGPADRNESVGPNKPFQDIAQGLASQGIAVLRYDKRTLVYGKQMAAMTDITVKQETTADAVAAVALMRATPGVDPSRVFVVGHSLGAYLAPRIVTEAPAGAIHGIAMLEASSSSLPQLMLEQVKYLASLEAPLSEQAQQQVAALEAAVQRAESPDLTLDTPASELPFATPASYWLDLRTYHPLQVAAGLHIPMFFSQGGRDYQVPPSELQPWRTALAGHPNVTFKTYPSLDHMLFSGTGPSTPAEYTQPHHVAPQLIADLGAWIKAQ